LPFLLLLLLPALLSACISMAPEQETPEAVSRMPAAYAAPDAIGEYRPAAWWRSFEDETLDALVEEALRDNLDIAEAAARLERARAQARIARSALFPSLDANAGSTYSNTPLSGSALGAFGIPRNRLEVESYSLGLGASYELDLFGRNRDDWRARRADAYAAAEDFRAVQLAAAAQAISTYFEIVDGRRQIELLLLATDVLADRVERTEERYQRGLVESFELYQVRQQLRDSEASLPLRESALASAEGRFALLLRDYPEDLRTRLAGPLRPRLVFAPVPAGLPSELLAQRPDVAAAWQRLEAARLAIGARRAERFPSISISGSIGGQGANPGDAVDFGTNWAASLASNIVAPIFDAGRISANIRAARATYDERAAAYAGAVLNAYREVDFAIEDYEEKRQRYALITAQLADARASRDLQARRFRAGVGGYIAYLDAQRAVHQVEASLSAAAHDVALARLGVHRALGGDWSDAETFAPVAMEKAREGDAR
jgi:NodT family efflux transporter outer membrane factor (OMF) lipoprotein